MLRFDELQAEELPDTPRATTLPEGGAVLRVSDPDLPVICKLNRKRVPFASAYDEVTLWNVRRVRVRERRMRLSDTTRREPVRLLKFFTERGRRRGARPHLSGNVAGCVWSALYYDSVAGCWDSTPMHISGYTLRADYDSVRRAGVDLTKSPIPRELWHPLPPDTRYVLDGEEVEGSIIHMLDGLILRSLDVVEVPNAGTGGKLVVGTTYPKRVPLVIFGGRRISIAEWMRLSRLGFFNMSAAVPMRFFYMLPAEAVSLYGPEGRYGAICIDLVS